ncbi:serine/threonine protein kinase [Oleiphilus messinensis]|uniref:Serine/threonine protein kinase n=1 Tax=Oleiphilus messinensis TaxID=141451 RepID=A0A1Y0I1D1_9GAMM|nr:serine/threonine-protein kinase [Oleiphilus messinensis]ARU54252.1 serine/threonine protein kinase [Oleiphilus messinensis]
MEIPGYTISRELGRGGMATVYLGVQESFGRKVAIKVLDAKVAQDQEFAERFLREARIVAGLSHPHIVPVYDVGLQNEHYYMTMDYLSGGVLPQWIKAGLEKAEVIQICREIASALQFAHDNGYIHRDIKPDNIMFRGDNSAVLTDFGVARAQKASEGLTQAGTIIGTPTYMSPEQISGEDIDSRADLYSLGVVLYEMLMKVPPYQTDDFLAMALKHVQDPIPEFPWQHAEFQDILNRLMAKDAEDRFQSGRELIKALKQLEHPADPPPVPTPEQSVRHNESVVTETVTEAKTVAKSKTEAKPDNITAQAQSPDAKAPAAVKRKEGLFFNEKTVKKLGMFKSYILECEITSPDSHHFSILFSRLTTKLVDWHDERDKKSKGIELNLYIPPWTFQKAKDAIQKLYQSGGTYAFLQSVAIEVVLTEFDGQKSEHFSPSKG